MDLLKELYKLNIEILQNEQQKEGAETNLHFLNRRKNDLLARLSAVDEYKNNNDNLNKIMESRKDDKP